MAENMLEHSALRGGERYVSWWLKWEDLNWPNADNFDRIRRRADLMAENSVTAAIIFGAHFRWDWLPFFEILHDYLATVADELHQRGMKLYDHHSVNLVHRYDTREEMRNVILHSQPHLPFSPSREAAKTWRWNGKLLNDWRMIDTVTRKPLYFPQYTAEGFCYRNPEFVAAYCEYAKKLIADTHIDGLMPDDTVHYQYYLSCACPVCRQALRERSGIDLPPADDAEFWGNWNNPAWKMWIDLRYESTGIFQKAVRDVLPPGFPTMSCGSSSTNARSANKGCDAVQFLRGCNMQHLELIGNLPPYKHDPVTWNLPVLQHFVNASYNSAAAEKVGARCVGGGYGFTEPSANIIWALNKCLGADCWFSTLKGRLGLTSADLAKLPDDFSPAGRAFRFEKAHPELFDASTPVRQAAVFFSRETRDHTLYGNLLGGLMRDFNLTQKLLSGAGIAVGTALEIPDDPAGCPLLVVPGAASVTPEEAERLRRFAVAGGIVLAFGPCGLPEAGSPWKLDNRVGSDFWVIKEGQAGIHPEKQAWAWREPAALDAPAEWREVAPRIFYNSARLPDPGLEKSLLELTRRYMRPLPVEIAGANGYFTTVRRRGGAYIVQLLAMDYDTDIDHHLDEIRTHRTRVNLVVKADPVNVSRSIRINTALPVEVFAPFNGEGAELAKDASGVALTLPEKCPYAVIRLGEPR